MIGGLRHSGEVWSRLFLSLLRLSNTRSECRQQRKGVAELAFDQGAELGVERVRALLESCFEGRVETHVGQPG